MDFLIVWGLLDYYHCCFSLLLALDVGLLVEVGEEEVEHDWVQTDEPDEGLGVVALHEEELEGVDHHQHELHLEKKTVS